MERNGGAISSAEQTRGDLVQHRPEQVVVAFVDQRHANGGSRQTAGGVQSGESAAHNDYVRMFQSTQVFSRSDLRFGGGIPRGSLANKVRQPID